MKTRLGLVLLGALTFLSGAWIAYASSCTITCGTVTPSVNTNPDCGNGPCSGTACGAPAVTTATGQITVSAGCGTRTVAYCETFLNNQGQAACTPTCNTGTFSAGTTVLSQFSCTITSTGTYYYSLTVNDITPPLPPGCVGCTCNTSGGCTNCSAGAGVIGSACGATL